MNIQKINMLSSDNQIKMKEEGTAPVSAPIAQEGAEPKDVMKAMDLFGKTNYMNNVAFQGGMANKAASYALAGLLSLGAASMITSCSDHYDDFSTPIEVNVETNVTVDMSAFTEMFTQLLNQMKEQQEINDARWNQMYSYMQQLINLATQGKLTQEEFFAKMFEYMTTIAGNQELILNQLVKNGMSQEDANKLLQELINEVKTGKVSAQEAWAKIQELLESIDANVAVIKDAIGKYYYDDKDILAKLDKIIEQNDTQIDQGNKQVDLLNGILSMLKNGVSKDDIKVLIDYAAAGNADMSKLIKLVEALNQNVTDGREENKQFAGDVIATLNKLGFENADNFTTIINKMDAMDSGAADLRALIQKFMNAYKNGSKLTNDQLKDLIDAVNNIKIEGGAVDLTSLENMLKELVDLTKDNKGLLTDIDAKVGLINVSQNAILDAIDKMHKDIKDLPNYKQDLAEIKALLQGLKDKPGYDDTKVLNKLAEILEVIKTHEFCHCKCDPDSGHNEGIINDINDIIG